MIVSIQGPEQRILLVGTCKSGKSATGNTILGSKVFESGMSEKSRTQTCQKEEALVKGRKVVVVDMPGFSHGFFDLYFPIKNIAIEVFKCMKFCSPGPHVILHVMDPLNIFPMGLNIHPQIKDLLGLKAKDYTIILFTCKDGLKGQSLEKVISSSEENLKEYIAECGNRYLAFNNKAEGEEREAQVAELMTMIDDLVERNRGAPCYTANMMNFNIRFNF